MPTVGSVLGSPRCAPVRRLPCLSDVDAFPNDLLAAKPKDVHRRLPRTAVVGSHEARPSLWANRLDVEVGNDAPAFRDHQDVALTHAMGRRVVDDHPAGVRW